MLRYACFPWENIAQVNRVCQCEAFLQLLANLLHGCICSFTHKFIWPNITILHISPLEPSGTMPTYFYWFVRILARSAQNSSHLDFGLCKLFALDGLRHNLGRASYVIVVFNYNVNFYIIQIVRKYLLKLGKCYLIIHHHIYIS